MITHKYATLVENGNMKSITVYLSEDTFTADSSHKYFDEIVKCVKYGYPEQDIINMFSPKTRVNAYFKSSGLYGCHFDGSLVWVNGLSIPDELSSLIIQHVDEGTSPVGLIAFFSKLQKNPSFKSRTQLISFIKRHGLTITPTGNFIAYKGVRHDGKSLNSGAASVDGVLVTGRIPNELGTTITMPRNKVNDDTHVGCSTGLHAGAWKYASTFGTGPTRAVEIDPVDVVSVPKDCNEQKLRVCRYIVVAANLDKPSDELVWGIRKDDTPEKKVSNVTWTSNPFTATTGNSVTLNTSTSPRSDRLWASKEVVSAEWRAAWHNSK
jgi:hypothetical protein